MADRHNTDEQAVLDGEPLRIAVVGHTNTGKTSLLRTLTRDRRFGEVSFRPGTTRHVEVARLLIRGRAALELYDTPGMEEPISLLELLENQVTDSAGERLDGPTRIRRFLDTDAAQGRFEQEAKVLRQMLNSDAAFYVIDARDPVLAKYRDELAVLNLCGIPLLPLLNFVAGADTHESQWRETLSRNGLHAVVSFDTVAPVSGSERLLYEKLSTLLDPHRQRLHALIRSHEQDARQRRQAGRQLIAELLIDVATLVLHVRSTSGAELEAGVKRLNEQVRRHERQTVTTLLDLYSFSAEDVEDSGLPFSEGHWQQDLFDPEALQVMGLRIGGGAAAGAATGLGIDLMVGGVTLGAAAAIGAVAGGGLQTMRHYGRDLFSKLTGEQSLRVDDNILRLLAVRQLKLLNGLEGRGHAALAPLKPDESGNRENLWQPRLPAPLRRARARPEWCSLRPGYSPQADRQDAVAELVEVLAGL